MQQALEQVAEFLEEQDVSYTRYDTAVLWPQEGPNDFPIVFTEGNYPGWVYATFSFGYGAEDGPSSVEGLRSLRKAVQEKYGGRLEVFCEGRDFCIVGRLKSDPQRLKDEVEDYIQGCGDVYRLIYMAVQNGKWKQDWNSLALGQTMGNA